MADHDLDKGGEVSGAKKFPERHVAAAGNTTTNNDARLSESVGELRRQHEAHAGPNAAGGPGEEYGTDQPRGSGMRAGSSYRKGG